MYIHVYSLPSAVQYLRSINEKLCSIYTNMVPLNMYRYINVYIFTPCESAASLEQELRSIHSYINIHTYMHMIYLVRLSWSHLRVACSSELKQGVPNLFSFYFSIISCSNPIWNLQNIQINKNYVLKYICR